MENSQTSQKSNELISDRLDLILLSNAKRMALSFSELNELRVRDFIEMIDIHTGKKKNIGPRQATQDDIDKLLS